MFRSIAAALAVVVAIPAAQAQQADPAIASAVFVTTITDMVGFFAFLGLATVLLL